MPQRDIRIGDIGTVFEVTVVDDSVVVDVSTASTKEIIFVDPDGRETTHAAAFSSSGTDGKIRYSTQSGDIYRAGNWQIRARVVIAAGTFNTSHKNFTVKPN
jgi:hypothetical protein